ALLAETESSRASVSGASASSCGRKSARRREERPRLWAEASFEVNGSPPPGNNHSSSSNNNSMHYNSNSNNSNKHNPTINGKKSKARNCSPEMTKTPRSGPMSVIRRPADFCHVTSRGHERRAASETLPFTLEHEKSSLLSGRAFPLTPNADNAALQATPRQRPERVSPAVGANITTSKREANNHCKNSTGKSSPGNANGDLPATSLDKLHTAGVTDKGHHSSFYSNVTTATKQPLSTQQCNQHVHKQTDGFAENRKPKPRSKMTRAGGVVSKCLRCQKLFNSVDNHKLACCYHPKEKARFEHYDGSGRLVAVRHAWQCCKQDQDADGCCFGQHV
ncbi:hypothetical protein EGW08_011016, partial [Elysia chlorotica]